VSGSENLDFFTDKSLVDDPYDYYDAIRRCPIWRDPAHGVVMVSGYDEAVAVQRDADRTLSVCNIVSGPWSGIPIETDSDDISGLIERHRQMPIAADGVYELSRRGNIAKKSGIELSRLRWSCNRGRTFAAGDSFSKSEELAPRFID